MKVVSGYMEKDIFDEVEGDLGRGIVNFSLLSGGSIARSFLLKTTKGDQVFLKTLHTPPSDDFFFQEAIGLRELAKAKKGPRIPKILSVKKNYLLMEYIKRNDSPTQNDFIAFGEKLAMLHSFSEPNGIYGFRENNYLGRTLQKNNDLFQSLPKKIKWKDFFWKYRIERMTELCKEKNQMLGEVDEMINFLYESWDLFFEGIDEVTALIHGDLWTGNFLFDDLGHVYLIDPAVHYAHREAEFGMIQLFANLPNSFFKAYESLYPLSENFYKRLPLYKLYHALNHLYLFGHGHMATVKICLQEALEQLKYLR